MGFKFIIFILLFCLSIGLLFFIFSIMDPDIISKISNLTADTFFSELIFLIFYGFLAMLCLAVLGFIIFLILADPMVSTCFWIVIHIFLLLLFSPYFLVILIIGIIQYSFSAAKNAGNTMAAKAKAAKDAIAKAALDKARELKERAESAKNSIKERAESAKNSIKERAESAKNSIKERAESAKNSIKERAESAKNSANNLKESAKNSAKNSFSKIMSGGGDSKSELEKFLEILEKTDHIQLWYYLLYVYTIQNFILEYTKDLMQKMQEGINMMKEVTKLIIKKYDDKK